MLIVCPGGPKKYSWSTALWAENLEGRELKVKSFWLKLCVGNCWMFLGRSWETAGVFTVRWGSAARSDKSLSKLFTTAGLLNKFTSRIGLKSSSASSNFVTLCLSGWNSIFGVGRPNPGKGTAAWTSNWLTFCLMAAFWSFSWTNSLIRPSKMDRSWAAGLESDSGCDLFSKCLIITKI